MSRGDPLPGRDLAAFVAAVESGTVQGAADALQLTQSAATKRIQALERRVGRALLERGSYGVRATGAGMLLYPAAREALDALERAEAALRASDARPVLSIHASRTIGEALLPGWLAAFQTSGPACRISVAITNSDEVAHAVREGETDIGFVEGPAEDGRGMDELDLGRDEIRVVVDAGHPWASRRALAPSDLRQERFLAREPGSGTRAVALAQLSAAGVELEPAVEVSSTEGLKRVLLSGGFALLSQHVTATEVSAGTLAVVPLRGVDLTRPLRAIRRSRPTPQGIARAFWSYLERTFPGGDLS